MTNRLLSRRALMGAGLSLSLLGLSGCMRVEGYSFEKAVRRLLGLSSERAFAGLLREGGFLEDAVAQVALPPQLGGTGATSVLATLLQTPAVQDQLRRIVNDAATASAQTAAPFVLESIRGMRISDAFAIVRGGSTAATAYLERSMGNAIFEAMLPGVGTALAASGDILPQALRAATGIDLARLQHDVAVKASQGIYRAIAREEAAIRADPEATGDPMLGYVFGVLG